MDEEHKAKIAASIREHWKTREKVPHCECGAFLSKKKSHNCEEIRKKQSETQKAHPLRYWLGKKRDQETKQKISATRKSRQYDQSLEKSSNWQGGKWETHSRLARKLMKKKLDRELTSDEIVHHIDGNHFNTVIENLSIVSRSEHIKLHREELYRARWGI